MLARWCSLRLHQKYVYGATLSHNFDPDVDFYPNMFQPNFFGASTRRMVLVGPPNSHHTTQAGATLALGGSRFVSCKKYAYGVALSRDQDRNVGFFPNIFWPIFV